MAAVLDPLPSLQPPEPGPSRYNGSRAASVVVQPSSAGPPVSASSRKQRASHAVTPSAPLQDEPAPAPATRDVYSHPAAAAYAQAHPRRTIPKFGPYLLLQTLGEGEFGKVKLGLHSQWGEEVAVKLIRRGNIDSTQRMSKVEREIEVLRTLKHPNIVRLYDVIETDKYIGIILEYASGGELFDHILAHRYLKEKDACKLFAQLISGVWYIHQKKIVHRDLKLENLLLDRHRNVIITDFGFANRFEHRADDLMQTSCGSPCYAAPELVISEGAYVGTAVDIWSCGVILYAMLAGYLPFDDDPANPEGDNINLLYRYIVNTPLSFPDYISAEARELLKLMLVPDPNHRASLPQIMRHSWLQPYAHLFDKDVDDLERAAMEQHQMKRMAYQRQMKQAAAAKAAEATKMTRSQSARTDAYANGGSSASRSRSHQQGQYPSPGQQEYLYDSSADLSSATPAAAAATRKGYASAIVLPSQGAAGQSPARLGLDDDPFAPAGTGAAASAAFPDSAVTPTESPVLPGADVRARVSSASGGHSSRRANAAGPPPPATEGKKSRGAGGFRHTIQVEVGENDQDPSRTGGTPERRRDRDRRERDGGSRERTPRKPSLDTSVKALPAVPPGATTPTGRTRPERGPPPASSSATLKNGLNGQEPPVVSVSAASPPATTVWREREVQRSASRQSSHKRGISVDKLGLGKIFGVGAGTGSPAAADGVQQQPSNGSGSSRVPSEGERAGAHTEDEEDSSWYLSKKTSKDGAAEKEKSGKPSWYMGKRPSLQVAAAAAASSGGQSPEGADVGKSPGPAMLSPSASVSKKNRRNTLTVMVEPFSRTLKGRTKQRGATTDATTPTAEKTPQASPEGERERDKEQAGSKEDLLRAPGAHTPVGSSYIRRGPALGPAGLGMPASTSKARKVMEWFRSKSKGGADGGFDPAESSGLGEESMGASTEHVYPAPPESASAASAADLSTVASPITPAVFVTTPSATEKRERKPSRTSRPGVFTQRSASGDAMSPSGTTTLAERVRRSVGVVGVTPSKAAAGVIRIHHGAVDQTTITTGSPPEVMEHVKVVLQAMGVAIHEEGEFKYRCVRPKKRKSQILREGGTPATSNVAAFTMVGTAGSNGVDRRGLPIPSAGAFGGGGMLRGLLMRRQSSQVSSIGDRQPSESETALDSEPVTPAVTSPSATSTTGNEPAPIYGDRMQDMGDEVRFSVELTRMDRLNDTYSLDIRRLKGNLRSYKFVYEVLRDRADLQNQVANKAQ